MTRKGVSFQIRDGSLGKHRSIRVVRLEDGNHIIEFTRPIRPGDPASTVAHAGVRREKQRLHTVILIQGDSAERLALLLGESVRTAPPVPSVRKTMLFARILAVDLMERIGAR